MLIQRDLTKIPTCDWRYKSIVCENKATEKWTAIPKPDPLGGWENVMHDLPEIYYYCNKHIAEIITKAAKTYGGAIVVEKLLKEIYFIEKLK